MLSTHLIDSLATLTTKQRVEERRFNRSIRNQRAMQDSQRKLRRQIEKLLKIDGNVQSVLDVLEDVTARSEVQVGRGSGNRLLLLINWINYARSSGAARRQPRFFFA